MLHEHFVNYLLKVFKKYDARPINKKNGNILDNGKKPENLG